MLPRADKLRLMQFLVIDLAQEEGIAGCDSPSLAWCPGSVFLRMLPRRLPPGRLFLLIRLLLERFECGQPIAVSRIMPAFEVRFAFLGEGPP